uniref:Uncharacterized protein n=1 Tax=Panagrolaimus davidi TaxID=227884 RepID=A0A914PPG9_9BILA
MRLVQLFLLLFLTYTNALSPHPGAVIRISPESIKQQIYSLLGAIEEVGRTFYYPDTGYHKVPRTRGLRLRLLEIRVTELSINKDKTVVNIDEQGNIFFEVNDITVACSAHYRLHWNQIVPVTFAGDVWGKGSETSISVKLKIENRNERPFLTNVDKKFHVGSITFKGKGGDIGWLLNIFRGTLKPYVLSLINDNGNTMLGDILNKLSQDLQKMKIESGLKTPGFNVNFGLMNQPQLKPSELRIPIIAQFWFNGHRDDNPPTVFPSKDPFPLNPPDRQFCLNIDSNLAFRSAVYAFNVSDKAVFRIDQPIFGKLSPERRNFMLCDCQGENCLISMVPKLKEKCPNGKSIWIHGILQIGADLLANNSGLIFYASGNGNFSVDFGDEYDAEGEEENALTLLSMKANVGVLIEKNVTISDWTVHGKSKIFYTHLEATTIFGDIIPKPVLELIWSTALKDVAQIIANGVLDNGMPLPPIDYISFKNAQIKFNGPLVEFCSDFNVDFMKILKPKIREIAAENMEEFFEEQTKKFQKYLRKKYPIDKIIGI